MDKDKKQFKVSAPWKVAFTVAALSLIVLLILLLNRSQSFSFSNLTFTNEQDQNGDEKTDEWLVTTIFMKKIEFRRDKNYDGIVDYLEIYENDRVKTVKVDFDYNGTFDTIGHFDIITGHQTLLEKDTNNDGKFDIRATYDEKGLPLYKEIDKDYDGTYDMTVNTSKGAGK